MIPRAGTRKCHSERSEESPIATSIVVLEMLRYAQHDN